MWIADFGGQTSTYIGAWNEVIRAGARSAVDNFCHASRIWRLRLLGPRAMREAIIGGSSKWLRGYGGFGMVLGNPLRKGLSRVIYDGKASNMGAVRHEIREILISEIEVGRQQLRAVPESDGIGELAQDIARRGLLQAIGVAPVEGGGFQLLFGSRRLAACRRLGWARVPARVFRDTADGVKATALVENLMREQLSLGEECEAVQSMVEHDGLSVESIAAAVSKSRSWVLERLMVPGLEDFIREPLLAGALRLGHVAVLGHVPSESARRYLVACTIQSRWTVAQLKQIAAVYEGDPGALDVQPLSQSPEAPVAPAPDLGWRCEACGSVRGLAELVLLRVCKDGCRSESDTVGSDQADSGKPRVEGDTDNGG